MPISAHDAAERKKSHGMDVFFDTLSHSVMAASIQVALVVPLFAAPSDTFLVNVGYQCPKWDRNACFGGSPLLCMFRIAEPSVAH